RALVTAPATTTRATLVLLSPRVRPTIPGVILAPRTAPIPHFFFYCYAHPRHLHSFPTRRSSDLRPPCGCRTWLPWGSRSSTNSLDRKSTRLNSSHLVISYAVFCLKKKNQRSYRHYLLYRAPWRGISRRDGAGIPDRDAGSVGYGC